MYRGNHSEDWVGNFTFPETFAGQPATVGPPVGLAVFGRFAPAARGGASSGHDYMSCITIFFVYRITKCHRVDLVGDHSVGLGNHGLGSHGLTHVV